MLVIFLITITYRWFLNYIKSAQILRYIEVTRCIQYDHNEPTYDRAMKQKWVARPDMPAQQSQYLPAAPVRAQPVPLIMHIPGAFPDL